MTQSDSSSLSFPQRLLGALLGLALLLSALISIDAELHRDTHGGKDCQSIQCLASLFASGAVSSAADNAIRVPPPPESQEFRYLSPEILLSARATKALAARDPPVFSLQAV